MDRLRPLERAFELARSGECMTVTDIKDRMKAEGLSTNDLVGPFLLRQLRELCTVAGATRD